MPKLINKNGAKGITKLKSGRYRAVAAAHRFYLGTFKSVDEAVAARERYLAGQRRNAERFKYRTCQGCGRRFIVAPCNDDLCFVCKTPEVDDATCE